MQTPRAWSAVHRVQRRHFSVSPSLQTRVIAVTGEITAGMLETNH